MVGVRQGVACDLNTEVFEGTPLHRGDLRVDPELRERPRLALELLLERVNVIEVYVSVPNRVDELSALEVGEVGEEAGE